LRNGFAVFRDVNALSSLENGWKVPTFTLSFPVEAAVERRRNRAENNTKSAGDKEKAKDKLKQFCWLIKRRIICSSAWTE